MKKIILVGGAPTTGKSTIAQMLSKYFNLPWISTDQIREVMRSVTDENKFPKLFGEKNFTAEKFHNTYSPQEIVDMEYEQSIETWVGIKAFIKKDYTWRDGFILEGVNILPHLVNQDFRDNPKVQALFLVDEDTDRIRDVIYKRGLWGDASEYSDEVKEKEIEWVKLFSKKIQEDAGEYNYPCVEVGKNEGDIKKVLEKLV